MSILREGEGLTDGRAGGGLIDERAGIGLLTGGMGGLLRKGMGGLLKGGTGGTQLSVRHCTAGCQVCRPLLCQVG